MVRTAQPCRQFYDLQISTAVLVLNVSDAAPPHIFGVIGVWLNNVESIYKIIGEFSSGAGVH